MYTRYCLLTLRIGEAVYLLGINAEFNSITGSHSGRQVDADMLTNPDIGWFDK